MEMPNFFCSHDHVIKFIKLATVRQGLVLTGLVRKTKKEKRKIKVNTHKDSQGMITVAGDSI